MIIKGILVFIGIIVLAALICQGLYLVEKYMIERGRE